MRNEDGHGARAAVIRHIWVGAVKGARSVRGSASEIKIQRDVPIGSPSSGGGDRSGGETNSFCDRSIRKAIVSPRFVREPEESEENDRTHDDDPTAQLGAHGRQCSRSPYNSGNLKDHTEFVMGVGPVHVRLHRRRGQVEIDAKGCQRNGAKDLNASKTHEAEIPARAQVPVA